MCHGSNQSRTVIGIIGGGRWEQRKLCMKPAHQQHSGRLLVIFFPNVLAEQVTTTIICKNHIKYYLTRPNPARHKVAISWPIPARPGPRITITHVGYTHCRYRNAGRQVHMEKGKIHSSLSALLYILFPFSTRLMETWLLTNSSDQDGGGSLKTLYLRLVGWCITLPRLPLALLIA